MAHSWEHLEGYQKFRALLSELFQFDLADLDFGLYRLLKQRRRAIEEYFAEELPKRLSKHIHALDQQAKADIEAERKATIDRLRQLAPSAIEPDGTLAPIADTLAQAGGQIGDLILRIRQIDSILSKWELAENQVNDALLLVHDFFRRYYDEGDFIPQPRFSHGEGYAIESYRDCALAPLPQDFPGAVYHGEDTYFHWPTRGMHYAKSDTYLKNYSFQVETQGPKPQTFTVQFVLADVEPVRDNNRVTRYFFPKPEVRLEGHTLTIPFDYRSKRGGDPANQEKILETTLPAVLASIPDPNLRAALENTGENGKSLFHRRARHFSALGSKDFFIHPRLEDFLQAELDYFTKSQALRHAELGDDRLLRRRLATLKAFRGIAQDLIRFLGQLERIQTQLFEKKRLVYRTDYIVPIRYVPKNLWPEILANEAQIRYWQEDMGLAEIDQGVLETHPSLPVFTGHFDPGFARKLLAALSERWDLDEITDGVLVHGENYGALRTLEACWREQVKVVYIDPPYNTKSSEIPYKNGFKHVTYATLIGRKGAPRSRLLEKRRGDVGEHRPRGAHRRRAPAAGHLWPLEPGGGTHLGDEHHQQPGAHLLHQPRVHPGLGKGFAHRGRRSQDVPRAQARL
jgi:adenine-specific DNA-methyltransferase